MNMSSALLWMMHVTPALTSSGIIDPSRLNTLHDVLNHVSLPHRTCEINTQYPDINKEECTCV